MSDDAKVLRASIGRLADARGLGAGATSTRSSVMRMNPNPPVPHVQGNLPATNAWTTRSSVFASEPNPLTPGIQLPKGTRLYIADTTQAHGFVSAYWPGRGWNFVPFADVVMESEYVRLNTTLNPMAASSTITRD